MIEPDDPQAGRDPNTIWALRDISFSVQKGDRICGLLIKKVYISTKVYFYYHGDGYNPNTEEDS